MAGQENEENFRKVIEGGRDAVKYFYGEDRPNLTEEDNLQIKAIVNHLSVLDSILREVTENLKHKE